MTPRASREEPASPAAREAAETATIDRGLAWEWLWGIEALRASGGDPQAGRSKLQCQEDETRRLL